MTLLIELKSQLKKLLVKYYCRGWPMTVLNKFQLVVLREYYAEVSNLTNCLEKYAIIKGEPLSLQAYDKLGQRNCGDVDILIPHMDLAKTKELLLKNGFNRRLLTPESRVIFKTFSHQAPPFEKSMQFYRITIDLNFDIFWGEYEGERVDIAEFLSDTIEMEIYGVKVKTLLPIKAMIQLILHHYKDMNSVFLLATRKSIKYNMFKDVYYLLKNNLNTITLDKLYAISSEYKIIPYVFYVLYYTGQIFDDDILKQYIKAFRTPEGESLLNCYGLCDKERKEWKYDFKTRLESKNIYDLIKDDLTKKDKEKITINKRVFLGLLE